MDEHPRDDLIRMTPLRVAEVRADDDSDGRLMVGTPIVFNQWTRIRGWEGDFMERVAPGALTKTLAERGDRVKVLFNHGMDPQIGDKPLGKPSLMDPRSDGLHTETPLARTSYNDDLIELLRSGAIDGMSFRFSVIRDEWNEEPGTSDHNPDGVAERTINELRLYEFGPVTFPAYEATTVGVRAQGAYRAWLATRTGPAADTVTADPSSDTPPVQAPVGSTRAERLADLRRLAPAFTAAITGDTP